MRVPVNADPADELCLRGQTAYQDGAAAEDAVERLYRNRGYGVLARRWRGAGAEIDLILNNSKGFVFVEVKKAKSHAEAAGRLSPAQLRRICRAGETYADRVAAGRFVEMRVDLATVDRLGQIAIVENILPW